MCDEQVPTAYDLLFVMRDLLQAVSKYDKWIAEIAGVNTTDLAALSYIEEADTPVTPKMLSAFLEISTGATTALIDRLSKRDFVKRVPHPTDRRGVILMLKPTIVDSEIWQLRNRFRQTSLETWQSFSHQEIEVIRRFGLLTLRAAEEGLREHRRNT